MFGRLVSSLFRWVSSPFRWLGSLLDFSGEKAKARAKINQEDLLKAARSGNIQALRKALNAGANPQYA